MICFPNAKINIGLRLMSVRPDGFHDIESFFFPINLYDILEVKKNDLFKSKKIEIKYAGNFSCITNDLCVKAYNLLDNEFDLPPIKVILYKNIPIGSGLGGGSSNAVSMLKLLNKLFGLNLNKQKLLSYCRVLGSDCSFFLENKPSFVSGLGDIINAKINFSLSDYKILLIFPSKFLSTRKIFDSIKDKNSLINENMNNPNLFCKILSNNYSIDLWKSTLKNDLEPTSIEYIPEIKKIKNKMYEKGAVYASMSGSGATVYGIFPKKYFLDEKWENNYFSFSCDLV